MLRGSRLVAVVVAVVVVVLAVSGAVVYARAGSDKLKLCAQLTDSAGLYSGNAVNIRGVRVGTVESVQPHDGYVTVDMSMDKRSLSRDMRVVAINNSVLADRRIELVDAQARGGATLAAGTCVPLSRTYTPISVSTAFQSFTNMFTDIGAPGSDSQAPIRQLLVASSRELSGTGPAINASVNNLAGFMKDPDEFLAQMRGVFDNLAVLTQITQQNFDPIRVIAESAASLTNLMGELFDDFVGGFIGLGEAAPAIDDLASRIVPPFLDLAEQNQSSIDVALGQVPRITGILETLPGIAAGLKTTVDRSGDGVTISYAAPKVQVGTQSVDILGLVTGLVNGGRR